MIQKKNSAKKIPAALRPATFSPSSKQTLCNLQQSIKNDKNK